MFVEAALSLFESFNAMRTIAGSTLPQQLSAISLSEDRSDEPLDNAGMNGARIRFINA